MNEYQRSRERTELSQPVAVIDLISNRSIGELVNITVDGMMIICNEPIATQSIFQFSLVLPSPINGENQLDIGVDCLWCSEVENFHRYWAGFQIIDVSEETIEVVNALIKDYTE